MSVGKVKLHSRFYLQGSFMKEARYHRLSSLFLLFMSLPAKGASHSPPICHLCHLLETPWTSSLTSKYFSFFLLMVRLVFSQIREWDWFIMSSSRCQSPAPYKVGETWKDELNWTLATTHIISFLQCHLQLHSHINPGEFNFNQSLYKK